MHSSGRDLILIPLEKSSKELTFGLSVYHKRKMGELMMIRVIEAQLLSVCEFLGS